MEGFYAAYPDGSVYDQRGAYVLQVGHSTGVQAPPPGPSASVAAVGGSNGASAWLPFDAPSKFSTLTADLRLQYVVSASAEGRGSWMVCGVSKQPLFGLQVTTQTGALMGIGQGGKAFVTGQTLLPDEKYLLRFVVDPSHHVWGALLNGEWNVQDQPVPAGASVAGVLAQWTESTAVLAGAGMTVDQFEVTTE